MTDFLSDSLWDRARQNEWMGLTQSWFCHSCKVEVTQVRCKYCGKTKDEKK